MTNQELFKQAIADAKSVRDAAVANAKAALEETFTPKIMSMLSAKLNEMEEDEDEKEKKKVTKEEYGMEEETSDMEEGMEDEIGYEAGQQKPRVDVDQANDSINSKDLEEMDLEEILAELEKEEGKMKEGKMKDGKKEKVEENHSDTDADDKMKEAKDEEANDDDEVTELTVDELKDIIRDVLQDVMGDSEESSEETSDEDGEEESDEESISLDELLAELDMEESSYTDELPHDDISGTEMGFVGGKKDVKGTEKGYVAEKKKEDDEKKVEEAKKEANKAKKDLEEAIKVIKFLKKELNEVNLLNAKNTYVNKIFKSKTLSESQKVSVLKSMDKATNVKEAKSIYETLNESLEVRSKTRGQIKESIGFASKAAGVAPKQPIVESDAAIRRMQQLAGIIK